MRATCESRVMKYPIRLDQFLKLSTKVGSGGEAKILVSDGVVKVNGILELRRGRKIQQGDRVQVEDGEEIVAD